MPLTEMYKTMLEAGNPVTWETNRQKQLMGMMELQEKQRAMQANQQLRDLYAKGGQLDMNQVMAIDPATGIELQKAQNSMFMQNLQAQELQQKIQTQNLDSAAGAGFPSLVQYDADIASGMPQQQALQKFHVANGKVVSDAAKAGASWLQPGASYDPNQATPDNVRSANARFGRFTPHDLTRQKIEQQQGMNAIPPQMSSEQFYGRENVTPEGYVIHTPGMGGQALQGGRPQPTQPPPARQQPYEMNKEDVQSYLNSLPEGAEKESIIKAIESQKQVDSETAGVDITPEQLRRIREFSEVQKERKVTRAREEEKAAVQHEEENKRITEAFSRAMGKGGVSRVMNLISQSTSGPTESLGAELYSRLPQAGGSKSTKGMEAIGSLGPIAKEIKKTIERSPGPQSDKDVAIDALAAAAIDDPNIPSNQRMKGFLEFVRIIKERADALGIDPKAIGIDVDSDTGSSIPTAKTDAEADELVKTLKPGQSFIGPDGKTHTIKGL